MKKYFAKYLPVEEGIEDLDTVLLTKHGLYQINGQQDINKAKRVKAQKVKLFLCSRDIQIGDKVHFKDVSVEVDIPIDEKNWSWLSKHAPWSVVGEISPNDKWVKEGDEFDYQDVKISYSCEKGNECDIYFGAQICSAPHEVLNLIEIKCPCCETFK